MHRRERERGLNSGRATVPGGPDWPLKPGRRREGARKHAEVVSLSGFAKSSLAAEPLGQGAGAVRSSVLVACRNTAYKCCAARGVKELQCRSRAHAAHVAGRVEGVVCVPARELLSV